MLITYIAVYDAYINGYAIDNIHCLTDAYMWLYSEFIARQQLVMSSISY
jgi:hypothetical protein